MSTPANLLVDVLFSPADPDASDPPITDRHAVLILRRVFGLPLSFTHPNSATPRALSLPAANCVLCNADAFPPVGCGGKSATRNPTPKLRFDAHADHVFACPAMGRHTFARHQRIVRTVAVAAHAADLDASVEPRCFAQVTGSTDAGRRPGDVTLLGRHAGSDPVAIAVDVTVTSMASTSAATAETRKTDKYRRLFADAPPHSFVPFGLTVDGQIGPSAQWLCRFLAGRLAAGDDALTFSEALTFIRARLAIGFGLAIADQLIAYEDASFAKLHGGRPSFLDRSLKRKLTTPAAKFPPKGAEPTHTTFPSHSSSAASAAKDVVPTT